jgi:hypothetical protein
MDALRRHLPGLAVLLLLLAVSGATVLESRSERTYGDYELYWFAAKASVTPRGTDVYAPAGERLSNLMSQRFLGRDDPSAPGGIDPALYVPNNATPFLFALLAVVSTGDLATDYLAYQFVSLFLTFVALRVAFGTWDYPARDALGATAIVVFAFYPYLLDLVTGTPARALLGLVLGASWCASRGRAGASAAAGFLLGLALLLKPIAALAPAFLFLHRACGRRWRTLAAEGAGFAAALAAGALFAASHFGTLMIWPSWARRVGEMGLDALPIRDGNFSLAAVVYAATGRDLSAVLGGGLLAAVLVAFLLSACRRDGGAPSGSGRRADFLALSMGCAAFPLVSARAWGHYYVLALPLLLALWRAGDGAFPGAPVRRAAVLASALLMSAQFGVIRLGVPLRDDVVIAVALSTWLGALLAWSAGLATLAGGVRPPSGGNASDS